MAKIGVLLSGSGVYDGTAIQEAVLTLLAIKEAGHEYVCMAPNIDQHHVINHLNGEEMNETRNVLIESARIARGDIRPVSEVTPADIDALVLPGGFGAAKNLSSWAFDGPNGTILPEVKLILVNMVNVGKPICALCVSPTLVAKAFENSSINPLLTLGSDKESSEYDIQGFSDGIASVGANPVMKSISEIAVDEKNKIVSAPCYMMEADIAEVRTNIKMAIDKMIELI
jgi:enhancing lycopene biosynthesis protein 2